MQGMEVALIWRIFVDCIYDSFRDTLLCIASPCHSLSTEVCWEGAASGAVSTKNLS